MLTIRKTLLIVLFSGSILSSTAQSFMGTVNDEGFRPIPGVNVVNLNSGIHGHTNIEGVFLMETVQLNDTLEFHFLGFESQQVIVIDTKKPMNVTMEEALFSLDEVVIAPRMDALNLITDIDLQVTPVSSSQEILRQVPGLFIGQHAGGGKAEQIFLRGFDIDHGTDIGITVDGMPVNMVSHAHGQGYSDLHFVIPETIEKIDFGKGPYDADRGNFVTAGYVDLRTKDRLKNSSFGVEAGQFSSSRILGLFKLVDQEKQQAYVAAEYVGTDGAFESPQNFSRLNLMARYSVYTSPVNKLNISLSTFRSRWDASGQIPQRKVDDGSISRFGAIDDTEGGSTSRTNLLIRQDYFIDDNSLIQNSIYFFDYDFELFSNFTFFLNNPENGDQIKQKERRTGIGFSSVFTQNFEIENFTGLWRVGLSLRNDQSKGNELSRTLGREETLSYINRGDIIETNAGIFIDLSMDLGKFTLAPGLRLDMFDFQYMDALQSSYTTESNSTSILSPKVNVLYNPSKRLQIYLKTGKGFHSNDTRVAVTKSGKEVLPAAYGADLGFIWKATSRLILNVAVWELYLEQEFVYVGDEGIVEPSGKTSRRGVDLSARYQALDWLFLNFDVNHTIARSLNSRSGEDYIPLAPDMTLVCSLNAKSRSGVYCGLHARYLGDRPANEDNSILAKGYTVLDLNLGYEAKRIDIGASIQNVLNTEWNETQFATTSRLQDELESVEEIHFTPGTPFFLKGKITYKF